jgi:hypothetical protein
MLGTVLPDCDHVCIKISFSPGDGMRRGNFSTFMFSVSILFFSLNAFSVRATFVSYLSLSVLFIVRAPTMFLSQRYMLRACVYWVLMVSVSFALSAFDDFYMNYFVKFILIQTYVSLIFWMFMSGVLSMRSMERACQTLILVHAFFFISQLSYYLLTGTFVDFDRYVRESSSDALYATKALSDSLISIRALGLFSEPSFYAMTVLPAGVVLLLLKRRFTKFTALAFLTSLLSFSVAAIIVCTIILAIHFFYGRSGMRFKMAVLAAAILCTPPLYSVYDQRVNNSVDYDAVASRTQVFNELAERDITDQIFGNGLFWDERNNVGKTHMRGYEVRDSSFYVYLIFSTGAVGCILFWTTLLVFFREQHKRRYLYYMLPLLLFKFYVLYGMLWITLVMFAVLASQGLPTVGRSERSFVVSP